jgi:O-antigen ligase
VAKTKKFNKPIENSGIINWILAGTLVITLYFNSTLQDPFNTPKLVILMLVAAWCVPHLILDFKMKIKSLPQKTLFALVVVFIFTGLLSALNSPLRFQAFFGENLRRNGLLSYLSLAVIFLVVIRLFKSQHINRLYVTAYICGFLMAIYGIMQTLGMDFVEWNNPYNSIISTVGNPNFAAAIMAVLATLIFVPVLQQGYSFFIKAISLILVLILLCTIYLSDARQGLISFFIGLGTYFVIWLSTKNLKLALAAGGLGFGIFFVSLLGMLQIGPLQKFLYKGSVSVRGYYWNTGLDMFRQHPLTGVGLDRYGSYFKEYRDVSYSLNYGFDITSSNAHNVPIQFLATGGVFFGLSYILLLAAVLATGVRGMIKTSGQDRLKIGGILAAWLAFQAQSFVSIDNLGIAIWGWLLSAILVALSIEKVSVESPLDFKETKKVNSPNLKVFQPVTSGLLVLLVLFPSIQLIKNESLVFEARMRFNPSVPELKNPLKESVDKALKSPLMDPVYKVNLASYLVVTGFTTEGMAALQELNNYDPRNLDTLLLLSEFSEQFQRYDLAITYRLNIAKLDPWNAKNYLALGKLYKNTGQIDLMNKVLDEINSFASETPEGEQANLDLKI